MRGPQWITVAEVQSENVPVYQIAKILTDAQIKAIPTTPFVIIDEPEETQINILVCAAWKLDAAAGAYTNSDDASPQLMSDGQGGGLTALKGFDALGVATVSYGQFPIGESQVGSGSFDGYNYGVAHHGLGAAIVLADLWNSGAYTGGNAANTLLISASYHIWDTETGIFV